MKKVKICGLSRECDIDYVNRFMPDYCGFVINFPKSIRSVTEERAGYLSSRLKPGIVPVGVFVDEDPSAVARLLNAGAISAAQLHGSEDGEYIASLKNLTDKPVWQAFQIRCADDVRLANASPADFVLLDAGQGTGRVFDWNLLRGFSRPFGLAGGLNLENLDIALQTDAVLLDVSGGVETGGFKDEKKIERFIDRVRNG